jgi:hypothetical protein
MCVNDDLNMPKAVALTWIWLKVIYHLYKEERFYIR